jgi:hypothetical protein
MIREKIIIDTSGIRKINLDTAAFRDLIRHPYLEYENVRSLMQFRDFKGKIESIEELRMNHILPDSILEKMIPYFEFR